MKYGALMGSLTLKGVPCLLPEDSWDKLQYARDPCGGKQLRPFDG